MKANAILPRIHFGQLTWEPWHILKEDGSTPVASFGEIDGLGSYQASGLRKTDHDVFVTHFVFQNDDQSKTVRCHLSAPSLPAVFCCSHFGFEKQLNPLIRDELKNDAMKLQKEYDCHQQQMRALQAVATFSKKY